MVNDAERFSQGDSQNEARTVEFRDDEIQRNYQWSTDQFVAPGIDFKIKTPFFPIPDPAIADESALKKASCPASFVEVSLTNHSDEAWEGFCHSRKYPLDTSVLSARGIKGDDFLVMKSGLLQMMNLFLSLLILESSRL